MNTRRPGLEDVCSIGDTRPSGFFVLRTPLLPIETLHRLAAAPREQLQALIQEPEIREAIFLASPTLEDSVAEWQRAPESERGRKAERALLRYLARMSYRPTPFGLCAGVSVGSLGPASHLELVPRSRYRRHSRLDMDYVERLANALSRDPSVRRSLRFVPNDSLYRFGDRWRYREAREESDGRRYSLVSIEPTPYLDAVLRRAPQGATLEELANAVIEVEPGASEEEALAYVSELVDTQVLIHPLEPPVTGVEPIHVLLADLRAAGARQSNIDVIEDVRRGLEEMDGSPIGVPPSRYRGVASSLGELPATVDLGRLVQVDMVKPLASSTLSTRLLSELESALTTLSRLFPRDQARDPLAEFRTKFTERFEEREVPLLVALDEESGVGFDSGSSPAPLLRPLVLPPTRAEERARWGAGEKRLAEILARNGGAQEIELTDADLEGLPAAELRALPGAFSAMTTFWGRSGAAVDGGEHLLHLHGFNGPSGATLLGRFCHASAELSEHVKRHLAQEAASRPDLLHVEVVHLPEGRIGNILARPVLGREELVFLGRSGAPTEARIPVQDLRVSVRGARVVLRASSRDREIAPRLTSAHDFSRGLSVYRFLCLLQFQDGWLPRWDWGPLGELPFLPRVRRGQVVLSKARWRLTAADLGPLLASATASQRVAVGAALRTARRLPRWVAMVDFDNTMPIDLESSSFLDVLGDLAKGRQQVVLEEAVVDPDSLFVTGPEGHFAHEIQVPFVAGERAAATTRSPRPRAEVARSFQPGSEWLYVKLYCDHSTADRLLSEVIRPLVERFSAQPLWKRWFFIRYEDPHPHVRLRIHADADFLAREVFPALSQLLRPWEELGLLWKVQLDTYEREVERYGGPTGVVAAERLFEADSAAFLRLLPWILTPSGLNDRWKLAVLGIDTLLDDAGRSLEQKQALADQLAAGWRKEFRADAQTEQSLSGSFRRERPDLEKLLSAERRSEHPLAPAAPAFMERTSAVRPLLADIVRGLEQGEIDGSLDDLLSSYVHMHVNRLLRSEARAQELVLYDFLRRLYESRRARVRKESAGPPDRGQ